MESKNFAMSILDNYVKKISSSWWDIFITGLLFFIFGLIFIIWPEEAVMFIAYIVGIVAILVGVSIMYNSFKVKNIEKNYKKMKEDLLGKFFD
ncbi:MAG: DUF308 domain-containing protein [Candidatus Paceibacterota bacterium]|jgi:uncharacterized membrane protein HdeD (DUF308 family)|nr:DUF308 domain-containing protein [bacterium]